jgi:hypothetical protein
MHLLNFQSISVIKNILLLKKMTDWWYNQLDSYARAYEDITEIQSNIQETSSGWMEGIFGFGDSKLSSNNVFAASPTNYDKQKVIRKILNENAIYDPKTGRLELSSISYQAGKFITPTVKSILDTIAHLDQSSKSALQKGKVNVAIVQGKDVGEAHLGAQPYEVFQAASQFNSLEMATPQMTPYDGIEIYAQDNTQGPRQAIACAPGTFVRNYYETNERGSQFNSLEYLGLSHTNGYLIWGTSPNSVLSSLLSKDVNSIMIPCMIHTQVVGVTRKEGKYYQHITNKIVHQIYSSAVPVNSYGNGGDTTTQLNIAKNIILAQYIGTIGMGLLLFSSDKQIKSVTFERPRINLTLIGGGVFKVDKSIIVNCIAEAIEKFNGYEFDVYIHAYSDDDVKAITKKLDINIVEFGTDLSTTKKNDIDDYVLVVQGKNNIEVFRLRDYQIKMLQYALTAPDGDYIYKGTGIEATIFVRTEANGYKLMGFIGDDRKYKFFVNLKTDPHISSYDENNGIITLYNGRDIIRNWNI